MRGQKIAVATITLAALSCKGGEEQLVERLTKAASVLEVMTDGLEAKTKPGEYCYPLIDGWIRHGVQELGAQAAKDAHRFESFFDFATIILEVRTTSVGDCFNELALRYNKWKDGPYKSAIEACKSCMGKGEDEEGERVPLRRDAEACRVP